MVIIFGSGSHKVIFECQEVQSPSKYSDMLIGKETTEISELDCTCMRQVRSAFHRALAGNTKYTMETWYKMEGIGLI
jgi:hypothetical protein